MIEDVDAGCGCECMWWSSGDIVDGDDGDANKEGGEADEGDARLHSSCVDVCSSICLSKDVDAANDDNAVVDDDVDDNDDDDDDDDGNDDDDDDDDDGIEIGDGGAAEAVFKKDISSTDFESEKLGNWVRVESIG